MYIGDKSAATLNNRPITIHKFSFESGISTAYPSSRDGDGPAAISPSGRPDADAHAAVAATASSRPDLIAGFNANLRCMANRVRSPLEVRLIQDRRDNAMIEKPSLSVDERIRIETLYVRFATCLDDLPSYLQPDKLILASESGSRGLAKQFLLQIVNLQVSYHCLRMVIMQKFEELEYFAAGLEQTDMLILRKDRDYARYAADHPQRPVLGASSERRAMRRCSNTIPDVGSVLTPQLEVEKIRLVGASLLAIIRKFITMRCLRSHLVLAQTSWYYLISLQGWTQRRPMHCAAVIVDSVAFRCYPAVSIDYSHHPHPSPTS